MTIKYQIANLLSAGSFGLNVFSQNDLEQIHRATLDVLWNVGIQVKSPKAREIFGDHGCVVDEKTDVVKIPPIWWKTPFNPRRSPIVPTPSIR